MFPETRAIRTREEENRGQILYLDSSEQIARVPDRIRDKLVTSSLFSFDIDGTLIGMKSDGKALVPPIEGLLALGTTSRTSILASGAGVVSVLNKIKPILPSGFRMHDLFADLIVANEGAHVVNLPRGVAVGPQDIVRETDIAPQDIQTAARIIESNCALVSWVGHYPLSSARVQHDLDPFRYVKYEPRHTKVIGEADAKVQRYITSLQRYTEELDKTGATKIVIRLKPEAHLMPVFNDTAMNAVENEGYVNIVATGVNKASGIATVAKILNKADSAGSYIHFGNDMNDLDALAASSVGVVVNSDTALTDRLVQSLERSNQSDDILVLKPELLNALLLFIAHHEI